MNGLLSAYEATNFTVFDEVPVTLRIGQAYDDWLLAKGHRSATVITAWNPFSKWLSYEENWARQTGLLIAVEVAGLQGPPAEGWRGLQWHEESLCVFDAPEALVDEWLVRFEQHAAVRVELGSACRLVWHPENKRTA